VWSRVREIVGKGKKLDRFLVRIIRLRIWEERWGKV